MNNIGHYINLNPMGEIVEYRKSDFAETALLSFGVNGTLQIYRGIKPENANYTLLKINHQICILKNDLFNQVSVYLKDKFSENKKIFELNDNELKTLFFNIYEQSISIGREVIHQRGQLSSKLNSSIIEANSRHAEKTAHKISSAILIKDVFDLQNEMNLTGLTLDEIKLIQSKAKESLSYIAFLRNSKNCSNSVIIGLNKFEIIPAFKNVIHAEDYSDAYLEFYNGYKSRPDFMDKLTATGKDIIFLVPRDLMNHPKAGVTKTEMEWLLEHPDAMSKVSFVFGAYNPVSKQKLSKIPYKEPASFKTEYRELLAQTIFSDVKSNNLIDNPLGLKIKYHELQNRVGELTQNLQRCTYEKEHYTQSTSIQDLD